MTCLKRALKDDDSIPMPAIESNAAERGGLEFDNSEDSPRFDVLAQVARSLLGTSVDTNERLNLGLKLAIEALGATRGSIMIADPDSRTLKINAAIGLPPEASDRLVSFGEGVAGWVAEHDEPLVLHGDIDDTRFEGIDPSLESSLSVPLSSEGRVLGVLNLVRLSGKRFTDDELSIAAALADLAALAMEKASLYEALAEREARASRLLSAAINAQEQERRRIAADIHDGFLQDLTAVYLKIEMVGMNLANGRIPEGSRSLEETKVMVRAAANAIRHYIFEVRPPSLDQVGLGPTLLALVEQVKTDANLLGHFEQTGDNERVDEAVEAILYRTAQEALRNVVKHAQATSFRVTLDRSSDYVRLEVIDDGRGVRADDLTKPNHFGVDTSRERVELAGGTFQIQPATESGTRVSAVIPLTTP